MSFKQTLKMKLPFTRKGFEDYLGEKLTLIRRQQTEDVQNMIAQFAGELNVQFNRRINDLQKSLIECLAQEFNVQLCQKSDELNGTTIRQTDALAAEIAEELNRQLDRRVNDLQKAVIEQLTQTVNIQLCQKTNELNGAQILQTDTLTACFATELNAQLDRRINDLQQAVGMQNGRQAESLFIRFKEEMNLQLHQRTNDLQKNVIGDIRDMHGDLYGFFGRFPKILSFEVPLADHCNLNCAGCSHFSPLAPPYFMDLEQFSCDFKRMTELFGVDVRQIRLMGGEPLLTPQIGKYLTIARTCFPRTQIMIVTNGLLLPQMDESFWKTCKENQIIIAPTKYPINFDYDETEKLVRSYGVKYQYFSNRETTGIFEKYALDPQGIQDCEKNYRICSIPNPCPYLRNGRLYLCPIPPTVHYMNKAFGTEFKESPQDFIDIYQAKSAEEILEFLAKPIPFCRYCRRDANVVIPWSQSKHELSEWML